MPLEHNAKPGDLYVTESGTVWRVIGYQSQPTVTLERLIGPDEEAAGPVVQTHAVGCRNAEMFEPVYQRTRIEGNGGGEG